MNFIINMLKGMLVGVANVIPGVSGGTMAVSVGIYDKMLSAVSNLFKDFKKSIKTLIPIVIGCAVGILIFSKLVELLLSKFPFATSMAFTGLIIGGVPLIWSRLTAGYGKDLEGPDASDNSKKNSKATLIVCIIMFLIFLAISVTLPLLNGGEDTGVTLSATPVTLIQMFFVGVVSSATMIIPGVSGSLIMMILGFYFGIITCINACVSALLAFDIKELFSQAIILAPFAIGCLLGIFFIAKLIEWLFNRYVSPTYSAILGLIVSSPFAIFYKVSSEFPMSGTKVPEIIIGIILLALGCFITYKFGDEKTEEAKAENE